MNDEPRCLRGEACEDALEVRDEQGGWIGRVGALLRPTDVYGLCSVCYRFAGYAVANLRRDWEDLYECMFPSLEMRLRDPDLPDQPPSVQLHAQAPLRIHSLDTRALVVFEVEQAAEAVAEAAGLGPDWHWARDEQARLEASCNLLTDRWDELLALPPASYLARSLGHEPWEGHEADYLHFAGGQWWITRSGVDIALRLWNLHEIAELHTGRRDNRRLPIPCPGCSGRAGRGPSFTLTRDHFANRVYCERPNCPVFMSDDTYDRHRTAAPDEYLKLSAEEVA